MDTIEQVKQMKLEKARREGFKEGRQMVTKQFVTCMLMQTSFSVRRIAGLAEVSESYVKRVRAALRK